MVYWPWLLLVLWLRQHMMKQRCSLPDHMKKKGKDQCATTPLKVHQSAFPLLQQIVWHLQCKRGEVYFAHNLRSFSPWLAGSKAETLRQRNMTEESCWTHGILRSREQGKTKKGRDKGPDIDPKFMTLLPIQKNPEVCFPNFLGLSQGNQVGNQY